MVIMAIHKNNISCLLCLIVFLSLGFILHLYISNVKSLTFNKSNRLRRTPTIFNLKTHPPPANTLGDYIDDIKSLSKEDEAEHPLGNGWVLRKLLV